MTGGAGGIGRAIVNCLLRRGVRVAILDVLPEAPSDLKGNDRVLYIRCDITDVEAVNSAADQIRKRLGSPSILVNNAGIGDGAPVLEVNPDFLKKIVAVNMTSHFYTCAAFGPDMVKANKGHIVTVASMASFISVAATADYAATKAGVLAFHEGKTWLIIACGTELTGCASGLSVPFLLHELRIATRPSCHSVPYPL